MKHGTNEKPNNNVKHTSTLVWIDLEMSGLDPYSDTILEIATIITDNNLRLIKEGPSLVIHEKDETLARMSKQVIALHEKSNLITAVKNSKITLQDAEAQTYAFITKYAEKNSPLCGNSVWNDRNFLARYMPRIISYLHYRIIDVTTIKELVTRWYPHDPEIEYHKRETHRALEDIRESIAELKHYRRTFFI